MASLTAGDKQYFEDILDMRGGWVLDFTNATFWQLFDRYGIDIHSARYETYGTSKAKKLRAFWELESDLIVGKVLSEMLDVYKALCDSERCRFKSAPYEACRRIADSLCGKIPGANSMAGEEFPVSEFELPDNQKLSLEPAVYEITQIRLREAQKCLSAEAYLSAVIMCGSVLESVLLGAAKREPKKFNQSNSSPKNKDKKVKPFEEWHLSDFINVARDIGILRSDVQKFSHELRYFRNYIHPAKQAEVHFMPDKHTARLCLDALKAALADVAGER